MAALGTPCLRANEPLDFGAALPGQVLSTVDQIQAIQQRLIDYGFIHSERLPAAIASEELLCEPFVLCLPVALAIAYPERKALAEFRDEPFILFSRTFSPTYYDQVVSICVAAGFHPNIRHEARHWLTVISCVSKGMGITLVPRSLMKARFPDVYFLPIGESPVESVVRGAWLASEADNAMLLSWHQAVRAELSI